MKRLASLKLSQLSKAEMKKREMNYFRGGTDDDNTCNCGCPNNNISANRSANADYGYQISDGYGDGNDGYNVCTCFPSGMQTARGAL